MRILFLSNFYPPYEMGGYEQLCQEVAISLKKKGHDVAVITSNHRVNGDWPLEEGIYRCLNTEVELRPYRGTVGFFMGRAKRLRETLASFQEMVSRFQPDVIFIWAMWNLPRELPAWAESWASSKVVYYIADYWPTLPDTYTLHWQEPARHWYTSLLKRVLGQIAIQMQGRRNQLSDLKFEHVLCVSQAVRQRLIEAGLPLAKAQVVYNGIDLAPFLASRQDRGEHRQKEELSLLYAGRIAIDKGVHTAIEAVAYLSQRGHKVTLTLIGGGSSEYEQELRSLCQRLAISNQVIFRGRVPREQVPEMMAQFDILVFTSIWPEPLARIVQEAMAGGLVVVGTDVGGMPEILANNINGLTFSSGNAHDLAMQIERLILDPSLQFMLIEEGLRTVRERFDINRMFGEIETYLHEVVTGQK